jgi:hypothetical protein
MSTVTRTRAQPEPTPWHPCSHQAHLDELRIRYEDAAGHPYDRQAAQDLLDAVGELLNHLDGLHRDDTLVQLLAPEAL